MISVLLILALVGQGLGAGSEQELVQVSKLTQHTRLGFRESNRPFPDPIVNKPPKLYTSRQGAEGLSVSSSSDNPESMHRDEVAITIDTETRGGSNSNKLGQTLAPFTNLRESESGRAGQSVIVQIQAEEENHAANPASDIRQSTSYHSSTGTSESNKDGLCRELSQIIKLVISVVQLVVQSCVKQKAQNQLQLSPMPWN
ncbi:hypothetical protein PCANC_02811 [Puccinia coronata f. sp. avenae]|uniref:Uncharacterized protein n=1 Tax=Puccinia coronata f. sp. avenae TaxID=200324 RepID=A0A2N5W425_9BASI|nr:hypothetical protein PCANC_02811 [Puccinia coronata f. sp. avenae]